MANDDQSLTNEDRFMQKYQVNMITVTGAPTSAVHARVKRLLS